MRMAPPHLLLERPRHGLRVELVPLLSDHDLEREVEQQIAQLVAQLDGVAAAQGLIELERFLGQIGAQRVAALGMVPRAAGSQVAHQRERATEGGVTGGGLSRRMFGHATTIIARASNRFIVLHLARPRDIIRAPVSVSVRGRDQRAWVEVDLAAVIENARTVARVAGTRLLPVVKANAYGVGAVAVSKALEALDPWGYGVATVEEGAELRAAGIARPVVVFMPGQPALLHVANSAAALSGRRFAFDLVRPGVFLYGGSPGAGFPEPRPVVSVRARVLAVRRVAAGESVSYNAAWRAARPTTVATLGIGYADGLRRSLGLSGRGSVLLRGRRHPIIGAVTMDMTMVETGEHPVQVGDVATLIGAAGGGRITLEEFAGWSDELQR